MLVVVVWGQRIPLGKRGVEIEAGDRLTALVAVKETKTLLIGGVRGGDKAKDSVLLRTLNSLDLLVL